MLFAEADDRVVPFASDGEPNEAGLHLEILNVIAPCFSVGGLRLPVVALTLGDPAGIGPEVVAAAPGTDEAVRAAVTYVGGMTDRFAFRTAVAELDWDPRALPRGIDSPRRP